MKRASRYVLVAVAAAVLVGGGARAETEAEYLNPGPPRKQTSPFGRTAPQPPAVQPRKPTLPLAPAVPEPSPVQPPKPTMRLAPAAPQPTPALPKPRASSPALFAPSSAASSRRMSDEQREEWRFLKEAAAAGRFQTEASRLAVAKSGKPAIRTFAAMLIDHHTSVSNELVHMLHVRAMAPPMLANDQRKALNRLAKLRGAKFDREFLDEVGLRRQQEDVQLFERARGVVRDPQLKAWIERVLPTLRLHVQTAERLAPADSKTMRVPAAGAGAAGVQRALSSG